jgi:hypothetical protein
MTDLRGRSLKSFIGVNQLAPFDCDTIGAFYFMANKFILSENHLVNFYIENKMVPYENLENDKIHYLKEYKLNFEGEKRRIDLLIFNKSIERIDLIEFKNKPIELRDIFQISNYYYLFLKTYPKFENCTYCHLIGNAPQSRKIDSLITVGFERLKLWYFWAYQDGIDVYEQDREIALFK